MLNLIETISDEQKILNFIAEQRRPVNGKLVKARFRTEIEKRLVAKIVRDLHYMGKINYVNQSNLIVKSDKNFWKKNNKLNIITL